MSKNKKLLILNGCHSDIPLIKAGKELGFYVISSGNRPELIGHKYSDQYIKADYSNFNEILRICKELKIDGICSCANDFGAITASYVAEAMGLPGHDPYKTTLVLHHKDLLKEFSLKHDIPTPHADSFKNVELALSASQKYKYPIIIKPIDLSGGKGISVIQFSKDFSNAVLKAFDMSREKKNSYRRVY